jgi:beta-lactamase regulating signal transducer with metallopeptidase domain
VTAALFDHIWQSTLFAVAAGLMSLALAPNRAAVRYWLWFAASAKFLIPFSVLMSLGAAASADTGWAGGSIPFADLATQTSQPFATATPSLADIAPRVDLRPALTALWAAGLVAVLAVRLARWGRIAAALAGAQPLALHAPIPVKAAQTRLEPGLIGVWRPTLLMPKDIADHLAPEELATVVSHEVCHLQRRDNLTAAMHMAVEALFWFHPLVWWIGARLIEERERACDESVVASGAPPEVYAESVLKVCKLYLQSPIACAAGVSGSNLSNRMEAIMSDRVGAPLNAPKIVLLAAFAAATLTTPVAVGAARAAAGSAPTGGAAAAAPTDDEIAERRYEQARPRQAAPIEPARLDRYVGFYQLASYHILTVSRRGDRFYAELTGQPSFEVFPESESKLFYKVVPAQLSFESSPNGRVTALVLHQNGFEQRAPRVTEGAAKAVADALARRIRENKPSPGTERALRKTLESAAAGSPNYADMTPLVAATARVQFPAYREMMQKWGPLKSITFKRVGPGGSDQYDVEFENHAMVWAVLPLTADGKIAGIAALPSG